MPPPPHTKPENVLKVSCSLFAPGTMHYSNLQAARISQGEPDLILCSE